MPRFEYKGQAYNIPEGLSDDEAVQRIEQYLAEDKPATPSQTSDEYDPEEYEGFFQEVGEGIVSGLIAIPQGIAELGTSLVDVVFDTDYTQSVTDFAESVRAAGGIDPTGAAGEIAEVFTQFAVPGLGAASAVSKARVLASAPMWVKSVAQVGAAGDVDMHTIKVTRKLVEDVTAPKYHHFKMVKTPLIAKVKSMTSCPFRTVKNILKRKLIFLKIHVEFLTSLSNEKLKAYCDNLKDIISHEWVHVIQSVKTRGIGYNRIPYKDFLKKEKVGKKLTEKEMEKLGELFEENLKFQKRLSILKRAHAIKFIHYLKQSIPKLLKDIVQRKSTDYWINQAYIRVNNHMNKFIDTGSFDRYVAITWFNTQLSFDDSLSELNILLSFKIIRAIEKINVRMIVY